MQEIEENHKGPLLGGEVPFSLEIMMTGRVRQTSKDFKVTQPVSAPS